MKKFALRHFARVGNEDGIVMLVALIIMLLLTSIGLGALLRNSTGLSTMRSQKEGKRAFYAADGGIVYGTKQLNNLLSTVLVPTSAQLAAITTPVIPGFSFDAFSIAVSGNTTLLAVSSGPYVGLNSYATPYTVTSQASGTVADSGTARITQAIQDQLIPLFQFGIFYQNDLEIFPGPCMTFNGRIHSNSNLYLGPGSTCSPNPTVDSRITSVGNILRCRKDNPPNCGSAQIKKPDGTYASLTFDHASPNWIPQAYQTWGGLVQDSAQGVQPLNLPVGTADPIDLIRRGDTINPANSSESATLKSARMYWQAGLRILDGVAYDVNGNTVPLPAGVISTATFTDLRENKTMTARQIDIGNLMSSGKAPANGIVYVSETQNQNNSKAVRLVNGATLPNGGLTIASDNPMYVRGNYNTNNKKGAALMGDALTILSGNWNDANSSKSISSRIATTDTVNAAVITGNTTTSVGSYNGGVENLPRFLENWSGVNFTYQGSLNNLYLSRQATHQWPGTGSVYNPPNRIWSYDTAFNNPSNLPPGTPRVRTLTRAQWVRM